MKKTKKIFIGLMLAFMIIPTVVSAHDTYYSDSYMWYKYYDTPSAYPNGYYSANAYTSHNQRYKIATAQVRDTNGTTSWEAATGVGRTANAYLLTNKYSHSHSRGER